MAQRRVTSNGGRHSGGADCGWGGRSLDITGYLEVMVDGEVGECEETLGKRFSISAVPY